MSLCDHGHSNWPQIREFVCQACSKSWAGWESDLPSIGWLQLQIGQQRSLCLKMVAKVLNLVSVVCQIAQLGGIGRFTMIMAASEYWL
ncbi:hypothetical protein O23A_p0626 [Aeromonas salmonicida]|nr:hypothetical protein O23A_p0626 [Aeromonas salmonicida]